MALHKIKKGLDLPINGVPVQEITPGNPVSKVALLGADYIGLKPTMLVQAGAVVKRGQPLFEDKKNPGVKFTAPAAGSVTAVNRGENRVFQSLVIELNANEKNGDLTPADYWPCSFPAGKPPAQLNAAELRSLLLDSGLWTLLRTRPFGKVPKPDSSPHSIFVTAIDTNPLAADPAAVLKGQEEAWQVGIDALAKFGSGQVFVCKKAGADIPVKASGRVQVEEFAGPHPAGLPGLHIHLLDPVNRGKTVWYISAQDTAAIGKFLLSRQVGVERVIALGGPAVKQPRLLRTRRGACLDELLAGELEPADARVISGSVLSGRRESPPAEGFLGLHHLQVSALCEDTDRQFLGWLSPGFSKFSNTGAFLAKFLPKQLFNMTTSTNGSLRAIVPIETYEQIMPLDILIVYLLRTLAVGDLDLLEKLGLLELEEEDLGLATFVCPSKIDYGPLLRRHLTELEKELV